MNHLKFNNLDPIILKDMKNIHNVANIISEIEYCNKKIKQPISLTI